MVIDASRRVRKRRLLVQLAIVSVLGCFSWISIGLQPALLPALYLCAVTPQLVVVDIRELRLPNRLVLPGYLVVGAGMVWLAVTPGGNLAIPLVAGGAFFGLFLMMHVLGGMGMGDVKLAGVLGATLGLIGVVHCVLGIVLSFAFGGVVAVGVLVSPKARPCSSSIPFGPVMLAGFWVAVVATGNVAIG